MKKAFWLLLLLGLIACGPSTADSQPADADVGEETAVSAAEQPTDETTEPAETSSTNQPLPGATNLDAFRPATTVGEAAVVREQDWKQGAADPLVVIIEYGDFQ